MPTQPVQTEVGNPQVKHTQSVYTPAQFDALLEDYKKSNPEKYAIKLGNGDFDKQRAKLFGKAKKEAVVAAPEVKANDEIKESKLGRPSNK